MKFKFAFLSEKEFSKLSIDTVCFVYTVNFTEVFVCHSTDNRFLFHYFRKGS